MAQHFEAGPRRHTQVHGSPDRLAQVEHPTALHTGEMVVLGQVAVETAAAGVGPLDEQALVHQQPQVAVDGPEADTGEPPPHVPEHPLGGGMDVGGPHGREHDPARPGVSEPVSPERLDVAHDRVTVITGVSGSGKSSLAFATIFAEGQWRYIESLSSYARLFLERVDRPDVDRIEHIRPSIALEQKNPVRTARLNVGTAT